MIVRFKFSYPQYPVVSVGNKGTPIYLPPEVCEVLTGQGQSSKLDASQTGKLIKFANMQGCTKANLIADSGVSTIGLNPNENPRPVSARATLIVSLSTTNEVNRPGLGLKSSHI